MFRQLRDRESSLLFLLPAKFIIIPALVFFSLKRNRRCYLYMDGKEVFSLEQDFHILKETSDTLAQERLKVQEQTRSLGFKAREQAQLKIQQTSLAYEKAQEEQLLQYQDDMRAFEEEEKKKTAIAMQLLTETFHKNHPSAIQDFIKEVSAYGHSQNE